MYQQEIKITYDLDHDELQSILNDPAKAIANPVTQEKYEELDHEEIQKIIKQNDTVERQEYRSRYIKNSVCSNCGQTKPDYKFKLSRKGKKLYCTECCINKDKELLDLELRKAAKAELADKRALRPSITAAVKELLYDFEDITKDETAAGRSTIRTNAEAIAAKWLEMALAGDIKALTILLDRCDGTLKHQLETTVKQVDGTMVQSANDLMSKIRGVTIEAEFKQITNQPIESIPNVIPTQPVTNRNNP